ncbi:type III-A CRISPR-associated protein Csm2 [Gallibacterium anatis]|uniref:type III-A CRISPR-associated protein Csm2 n=1 Tax=Gallibacterium anatis TaxID=750 RepID=UPI0030068C67
MDFNKINFSNKPENIFSDIAEEAARDIKNNRESNKNTQLRKFYDELVLWNDRIQFTKEDKRLLFKELLPFIKMMKAKVAYAEGRKRVDSNFRNLFNHCIDQIKSPETLRDAKLFMEAVIGYCRYIDND